MKKWAKAAQEADCEAVGKELRKMMPWMDQKSTQVLNNNGATRNHKSWSGIITVQMKEISARSSLLTANQPIHYLGKGENDMIDRVRIFDTTLRDGEQAARISLNKGEKLQIARQLARLGVDVIEAGFPFVTRRL